MEHETWLWKIMLQMRDPKNRPSPGMAWLDKKGRGCFNSAVRFMPSLDTHETHRP